MSTRMVPPDDGRCADQWEANYHRLAHASAGGRFAAVAHRFNGYYVALEKTTEDELRGLWKEL